MAARKQTAASMTFDSSAPTPPKSTSLISPLTSSLVKIRLVGKGGADDGGSSSIEGDADGAGDVEKVF